MLTIHLTQLTGISPILTGGEDDEARRLETRRPARAHLPDVSPGGAQGAPAHPAAKAHNRGAQGGTGECQHTAGKCLIEHDVSKVILQRILRD